MIVQPQADLQVFFVWRYAILELLISDIIVLLLNKQLYQALEFKSM